MSQQALQKEQVSQMALVGSEHPGMFQVSDPRISVLQQHTAIPRQAAEAQAGHQAAVYALL